MRKFEVPNLPGSLFRMAVLLALFSIYSELVEEGKLDFR